MSITQMAIRACLLHVSQSYSTLRVVMETHCAKLKFIKAYQQAENDVTFKIREEIDQAVGLRRC